MSNQNRSLELTAEERKYIMEHNPAMLDGILAGNAVGLAYLVRIRGILYGNSGDQSGKNDATPATSAKTKNAKKQWFGYPTDITRVSPFFPLNRQEMGKNRRYFEDVKIVDNSWGSIHYTGPQLSIVDEDVFVALMVLISGNHKHIHVVDDKTTFEFKGGASVLLRTMYPSDRRPSKSDYTRLIDSLNRMMAAVIKLSVVSQVDSDGKPMKQVFLRHMLEYANWDEVTKQLEVRVSPFFYLAYTQGNVTYLDSLSRYDLSGSISKAMYRFIQSHREKYSGGYMVLAAALNMNLTQPRKEIRRKLRDGVTELVKKGILTEESGFSEHDTDIIILEKAKQRAVKGSAKEAPRQLKLA